MKCPLCDIEMQIVDSFLTFKGDTSPTEKTTAIRNIVLKCRNPQCFGHSETITHEEK